MILHKDRGYDPNPYEHMTLNALSIEFSESKDNIEKLRLIRSEVERRLNVPNPSSRLKLFDEKVVAEIETQERNKRFNKAIASLDNKQKKDLKEAFASLRTENLELGKRVHQLEEIFRIQAGDTLSLKDKRGRLLSLKILEPRDTQVKDLTSDTKIIPCDDDAAAALLGHEIGDVVTLTSSASITWKIIEIRKAQSKLCLSSAPDN